jgi:GR25 family glycosyltransferase involved in LPS biosynthesis
MNIDFNRIDRQFGNDIDPNIPIFQIAITGNKISEHYSIRSLATWKKLGYKNFTRHEATVPDTTKGFLNFNEARSYAGRQKSRPWDPAEKAIWESHYTAWKKVVQADSPCIIIEHDCYLESKLRRGIRAFNLFSFATTTPGPKGMSKSLACAGYYLTPFYARYIINMANSMSISSPVDGFIHSLEPWYPWVFDSDDRKTGLWPGRHTIDPRVGTVKKRLNK